MCSLRLRPCFFSRFWSSTHFIAPISLALPKYLRENRIVEPKVIQGVWRTEGLQPKPRMREKIGKLYEGYWKSIYTYETARAEELRHQGFTTLPTGTPGFANASVIIAVCADPRTLFSTVLIAYMCDGEGGPKGTFLKNMANATYLLQLATAACGLTSQWVSTDRSWMGSLNEVLDVPDPLEVHTLVPIGYPAYKKPAPFRRKLKEIVHYEKYDRSKYRTDEDILKFVQTIRETSKQAYKRPSGDTWA